MYQLFPQLLAAALFSNQVAVLPAHPASCIADHQAASIARAVQPDYPEIARLQRLSGKSIIRVDLADDGSLRDSFVDVSSGSVRLDQAAMRAAKEMVYAPEVRGCKPISGSYTVEVDFTG